VGVATTSVKEKRFAKQRVAGAQLVGVATTSVKEKRFAKQESLVFGLCESELPPVTEKRIAEQELCRENIYMLERCVVLHCQFYNNRGKRF
jgi:hypothetical protein